MTDLHDPAPASGESGIWATDALLDALGSGAYVGDDAMSGLLNALVADVCADALPALPAFEHRRRVRRLAPRTGIVAAAAFVVVSTGGIAAASVNAGPTSALFPLHQVLTGRPQLDGSQRQALEVKDKLRSAAKALADGKVSKAQKDVASAAHRLPKVAATDGQTVLAAQWTAIDTEVKARVTAAPAPTTSAPGKVSTSPAPTRTSRSGQPPTSATHSTAATPPSPVLTSVPGSPVIGSPVPAVAPVVGTTTPDPAPTTTPAPTQTPTTSPSPSDPATTGSASPTASAAPTSKHHKPGKPGKGGGTSGSVAPGSPPAPSVAPPNPSGAPVTVPPASVAPPAPSAPPASGAPGG